MKIYEKLLNIQDSIKGLGKDKKSYSFSYVTGNKLLSEIKPLMQKYKLILKQEVLSIDNERQDYNTSKGSKSEMLTKVMMRFTWIDVETGETDVNLFGANGQNGFEMGLGSALTYAERYFLMKYFHIATDEDDIDNPDRKQVEPILLKKEVKLTQAGYTHLTTKGTVKEIELALKERVMSDNSRIELTKKLTEIKNK